VHRPRCTDGDGVRADRPAGANIMLRLQDNPPMLPDRFASVSELAGDWWVAHTKPRCEKALAFDLMVDGVGFYLPMALKVTVSGGRKRRLMVPLFTSYLFVCGDAAARGAAMQTNRVVQLLPVRDPARLVDELRGIERVLAGDGQLELYPFAVVGARCRVGGGPCWGGVGVVVGRARRTTLVLQVSMLGCGAALEVEPSLLEPVE
jgi:hypothetical protein